MKRFYQHLSFVLVGAMPLGASAHPGHLDNAPIAHSLVHGGFFVLAALALIVTASNQIRRRRSARTERTTHFRR